MFSPTYCPHFSYFFGNLATLSTTFHNRTKSSSLPPPSGRAHANAAATAASTAAANAVAHSANNQLHMSTSQQSSKSPQLAQMRKSDKDKSNAAKPRSKSSTKSPHCTDMTSSKLSPPSPRMVNGHGHDAGIDIGSGGVGPKPNLLALNHLAVPGRDKKLAESE